MYHYIYKIKSMVIQVISDPMGKELNVTWSFLAFLNSDTDSNAFGSEK